MPALPEDLMPRGDDGGHGVKGAACARTPNAVSGRAASSAAAMLVLSLHLGSARAGLTDPALRVAGAGSGVLHSDRRPRVCCGLRCWSRLETTVEGFLLAAIGGIGLAVLFNQSRVLEYSLYPYAVILQVTPVVAIAPLC